MKGITCASQIRTLRLGTVKQFAHGHLDSDHTSPQTQHSLIPKPIPIHGDMVFCRDDGCGSDL